MQNDSKQLLCKFSFYVKLHLTLLIFFCALSALLGQPINSPQTNNTSLRDNGIDKYTHIDSTKVEFVGNGNLQNAYANGDAIEANTGLGVIFERTLNKNKIIKSIYFDLSINVASTSDTIFSVLSDNIITNARDFGEYLLLPRNSSQAFNFSSRAYFGDKDWFGIKGITRIIDGFNFDVIRSNSIWKVDDMSVNLNGSLTRVGLFHDFIPDHDRTDQKFAIIVGLNYSWRGIDGDISFDSQKELREKILKASDTNFKGFEYNLTVRLNNLKAEIMIPNLKGKNKGDIDGLTGTQFFTSITFIGGFPLRLEQKRDPS